MAEFKVGGFSDEVAEVLEAHAEAMDIGVGELIRKMVEQSLGLEPPSRKVGADYFDRLEEAHLEGDTAAFLTDIGVFESAGDEILS